jgi:hypothetical protein
MQIQTQIQSEEDIKQAIIAASSELLTQLHGDYTITHGTTTIRFGDLPLAEQQSLRQALAEQAQGELIKYQFD